MSRKDNGPEVLPPAAEVRKRVEEHLDALPSWQREQRADEGGSQSRREPPHEPKRRS
jgi:hypothetical protein